MAASEFKDLELPELLDKEKQLGEELFNLKIRHSMGQLESPMEIKSTRRNIAKVKTFISLKRAASAGRQG